MSKDIISRKTREVFREHMVNWVLREIRDKFDEADVQCDLNHRPEESGERRRLVEQYYHTVDWTNWRDVLKVLHVFEAVLLEAQESVYSWGDNWQDQRQAYFDKLVRFLNRDGLQWADGRITPMAGPALLETVKQTAEVFDAKHMIEQIRRMEEAVGSDPSLAIGTAKELVETCCKTILAQRGKELPGTPDMPTLTKATLKELKLVPEGIDEAARGADVIKRLLSNLGTIGNGLAELRGLYGTGHGRHGNAAGLTARHAKLAVGAAATLATFLFETHKETLK